MRQQTAHEVLPRGCLDNWGLIQKYKLLFKSFILDIIKKIINSMKNTNRAHIDHKLNEINGIYLTYQDRLKDLEDRQDKIIIKNTEELRNKPHASFWEKFKKLFG